VALNVLGTCDIRHYNVTHISECIAAGGDIVEAKETYYRGKRDLL
jgi:hypothetical protein